MKSVFRSAFDPVPRTLSPGAQWLVVGVLIVGIAVSVAEYLESSRQVTVAQEAPEAPSSLRTTPAVQSLGTRAKAPVRIAERRSSASSSGSTYVEPSSPASVREPSAPAVTPMSLQPGGDG